MTYDPEYDTPEILAQFAGTHGVSADARTLLLRPKPADRADLFHALNVAVNYREGAVNLHGIQLILLDKEARPVRSFHSLMWNNTAVLSDLARLAAE
jgi:cytochrome oxidase Cu insertion factor (SCO1/SenC/PrrC family)